MEFAIAIVGISLTFITTAINLVDYRHSNHERSLRIVELEHRVAQLTGPPVPVPNQWAAPPSSGSVARESAVSRARDDSRPPGAVPGAPSPPRPVPGPPEPQVDQMPAPTPAAPSPAPAGTPPASAGAAPAALEETAGPRAAIPAPPAAESSTFGSSAPPIGNEISPPAAFNRDEIREASAGQSTNAKSMSIPRRFLAGLVDLYLPLLVGLGIASAIEPDDESAVFLTIVYVVWGLFIALMSVMTSRSGSTLGKLLFGGRVVNVDPTRVGISIPRAFARYLLLFIPFGWVSVFGTQRRMAHDHIMKTEVISVRR